jgi:hypothetical protein
LTKPGQKPGIFFPGRTSWKNRRKAFPVAAWVLLYKKTRIITARDLTNKEKQFYRKAKKRKR